MDSALFEHHKKKFIIFGSCLVLAIILLATIPLALINSSNLEIKAKNSQDSDLALSHSTSSGGVSESSGSSASGSSLPSSSEAPSPNLPNVLYSTKIRVIIVVSVLAVVIIAASLVTAYILHKRAVNVENQRQLKELEDASKINSPSPRSYIRRVKEKAIIFSICMLFSVLYMRFIRKCDPVGGLLPLVLFSYVLLLVLGGCFYGVPGALTPFALFLLGFCMLELGINNLPSRGELVAAFMSILFIVGMMFTPSNAFVPFFERLLDKLA